MFDQTMKYRILLLALLIFFPGVSQADLDDMSHLEDDSRVAAAAVGYRWIDTDGNANRAAEYSYLDDSATFDMLFKQDLGNKHFSLRGDFNNENDYVFEGEFNYKALFRLNVLSERLYHNLDHIPYNASTLESRQPAGTLIAYEDLDINAVYGRRITIDEVKVRGKLPTYPAHINLAVWRMEKKGHEQLRFVDEACSTCHMQSKTRQVNRVTEEFKGGIDAHLGPVDIAFLQTLRTFKEKAATPNDPFGFHVLGRNQAIPNSTYDHSETPDSKLSESTFMVNLPPSGGFVSSVSYTLGKRTNESKLTTVSPVEAETDYQKLAGDVTYTPGENWTFNFRYRMMALESDVPATQTNIDPPDTFLVTDPDGLGPLNPLLPGPTILVRESIDIDRDNFAVFISYRPNHKTTFKGEYEREVEERSNTGDTHHISFAGLQDPDWSLPGRETTDRLRFSFYKRMLEKSALTLRGWYQHINVDNPAYGTTLTDSNELFFSASYKPSMHWGTTGSIDILRGEGSGRDKDSENLALGMWYIPNEIISADFNYGLFNTNIDEHVEFGEDIESDAVYDQKVHTISAGINLRPTNKVNCRLEAYHIRSEASFDPSFDFVGGYIATDDGVKEISEIDIRQNGLKTRLDWKISEMLSAGIEYTFDDYESRNSSAFDGTAQTLMASLSGSF